MGKKKSTWVEPSGLVGFHPPNPKNGHNVMVGELGHLGPQTIQMTTGRKNLPTLGCCWEGIGGEHCKGLITMHDKYPILGKVILG